MLLQAQQPVQVIWPLTSDGEAVYSSGIGSASFKAGPGLSTFRYDSINGATATGWSSRNLNPNAYFEYTIVPERDATLQINQLKFEVSLSSVNMRTALYYSKDDFLQQSVPMGNTVFVGKKSSRDLLVETAITVTYPETLSIRVYGWSAPTPAVNFYAGNVEFSGVIPAEEEEAPVVVSTEEPQGDIILPEDGGEKSIMATFTVPANVYSLKVECWGGGAGGNNSGGGGGGGAYACSTFAVLPGQTYNYFSGSAGNTAGAGGNSTFGTQVLAAGGSPGIGGTGGIGGQASACIGDPLLSRSGGNGGSRVIPNNGGGGGGGSATSTANGGNGVDGAGAIGGAGGIGQGAGGRGGDQGGANVDLGIAPGGGGGGAGSLGTARAGAAGNVIITYCISPTISLGSMPSVCFGATTSSLSYSGTTQTPDQYSIDYSAAAESVGFVDVNYTTLPASPIPLTLPAATPVGGYTANLYVKNTTTNCVSLPVPFTITVKALPVATVTGNTQPICSAGSTNITLSSTILGTTYTWTMTPSFVNGNASGTGAPITQVLIATTTSPGTATYTITPTANGCAGSPVTAIVNVNPIPDVVATPNPQTICSGQSTGIALTSAVSGTTFTWTVVSQVNVTGATPGSGSSLNQTLNSSPSNATGTATYAVTGTSAGCSSTKNVIVTVNPTPTISAVPASQLRCPDVNITSITISNPNNVPGTTFSWVRTNVPELSGIPLSGTGNLITGSFSSSTPTVLLTTTFTITASTANGCSSTTTVTVTVGDPTLPGITCPVSGTQNVTTNNLCIYKHSGTPNWNATATDNCSVESLTFSLSGATTGSGTTLADAIFNLGVTTVTWTATDHSGNTSTCTFDVSVTDDDNPVITCTGNKTVGTDNAVCTYTHPDNSWDATATDNCTGVVTLSYVLTGATTGSGSTLNSVAFNKGITTVTWTATDAAGRIATCSYTVTVNDDDPPSITCPVTNQTVNTSSACQYVHSGTGWNATASDNCAVTSLTYALTGVTTGTGTSLNNVAFNTGVTTVTWTASDGINTITCSYTVTVIDVTNPTITCPTNVNGTTNGSTCSEKLTIPNPVINDNCAIASLTWVMTGATIAASPVTGINYIPTNYEFYVGLTTIEYTVKDLSGNAVSCLFTVSIVDNRKPVITCPIPAASYPNTAGQCYATLTFAATAIDNCDPNPVIRYYVSGIEIFYPYNFPVGTTTVTAIATDYYNNSTPCTYNVTVLDTELPTITCAASASRPTDPGTCTYTVVGNEFDPTFTSDNCAVAAIFYNATTNSTLNGIVLGIGNNTITWTVRDVAGNISTCPVTITVVDNQAPVFSNCPIDITVTTGPGSFICGQVATWTPPTASDNCLGLVPVSANFPPGTTFPVGTTAVIYTAGSPPNVSTCTFNVIVIDDTPPTFTVPPTATVFLDPSCNATALPGSTGDVTDEYDNCRPSGLAAGYSDVTAPGACTGELIITRTWTLTDDHNNTTSQIQIINVIDNTDPVLIIPSNITVSCEDGTTPAETGTATATDNCNGTVTITPNDLLAPDPFCPSGGVITRTWTATDCSGNSVSLNQTITIVDTEPPTGTIANMTVACPADIPNPDPSQVSAFDNCGVDRVEFDHEYAEFPTGVSGYCPLFVDRFYNIYDDCGNVATISHRITVSATCGCQKCESEVPLYTIDLLGQPSGSITILDVDREGLCCDATHPMRCVSFNIRLDPAAVGLQITIDNGATPVPKEWKVDCTPEPLVGTNGDIICIPGGTYHLFTFCKQGANKNDFVFTSLAGVLNVDDVNARTGCNSQIITNVTSNITWNSISPGNPGDYNSYLSCTNCPNPFFNPPVGAPPSIQYEVCGDVANSPCVGTGGYGCDVLTVTVYPPISVTITPDPGAYCNLAIPTLTASVLPTGGTYLIEWYNAYDAAGSLMGTGTTFLPPAAGPYSVKITDTRPGIPCSTFIYNFDVAPDDQPPVITPPANLILECNDPGNTNAIQLWLLGAKAIDDHTAAVNLVITNNYTGLNVGCNAVTTVTWTTKDQCNNVATATATITLRDTQIPTWLSGIGSLDRTLECSDATGIATAQALLPQAKDQCDNTPTIIESTGLFNPDPFCPQRGTYINTFVATDDCGNSSIVFSQTITITDNTAPVWNDTPGSLNISIECSDPAALTAAQAMRPIASDNCDPTILAVKTAGNFVPDASCPNAGTYTNTFIATDDCGNITPVFTQIITITDNSLPVLTNPASNLTVECDGSGNTTQLNAWIANHGGAVASDACGGITWSNTNPVFSDLCGETGIANVTFTATDVCNNIVTTSASFIIVDLTAPTILCPPPVTAEVDPGTCVATGVDLDTPIVTEGCSDPVEITNDAPTEYPTGITIVTWTATDDCGNFSICTQTVTVGDNVAPIVICPADPAPENADPGLCSASVIVPSPNVTDPCPSDMTNDYTGTDNASGTYPVGITIVTWTITDFFDNVTTCLQNVTVIDTQLPTIDCPDDYEDEIIDGGCDMIVSGIPDPTYSDNCAVTSLTWTMTGATINSSPLTGFNTVNGQIFNIGVTTVTYTVKDAAGNSVSCEFDVWIKSLTIPAFQVTCPVDVTLPAPLDACNLFVTVPSPVITNPCNEIYTITNTSPYGINASGLYNVGTTTITWTIIDGSGNVFTCPQLITITDDQLPTILCPANVEDEITNGSCTLIVDNIGLPTITENCTIASLTWEMTGATVRISPATGMNYVNGQSFNVGITIVTYTVTDASGNEAFCTFQVWVKNLNAPQFVATCPNDFTLDNEFGLCEAYVMVPPPSISNPCNEAYTITNNSPYADNDASGIYSVGVTTIHWIITDASNNVTECDQVITVRDVEDPVINCPPNAIDLILDGDCSMIPGTLGNPTFTDNCAVVTLTWQMTGATNGSSPNIGLNYVNGQIFNVGITTVVYTAYDAAGNSISCEFTVWIKNLVAPQFSVTCPLDVTFNTNATNCTPFVTVPGPGINNPCNESYTITNNSTYATSETDASGNYPVGSYTFTWTILDASNNLIECDQTVTVVDDVDPTISCPTNVVQQIINGGCDLLNVVIPNPVFADNCTVSSLTWIREDQFGVVIDMSPANGINYVSGLTFGVGVTTVTYTVTDASGNTAECSFTVTILNNLDPQFVATCPADISVTTPADLCEADVTVLGPSIYNPCDEFYTITNDSPYGIDPSGIYQVGTTTIHWVITDASGNETLCTQTITVEDETPPTLLCPGDIVVDADYELPYASDVPVDPPTYGDACGVEDLFYELTGATTFSSPTTGINILAVYTFNVGVTTITYTAIDVHGNESTCFFTVTVLSEPVIDCPADFDEPTDPGVCSATLDPGGPIKISGVEPITWTYTIRNQAGITIGSGNCTTATVATCIGLFTFPVGTNTITWTATNISGSTECIQTIIVTDNEDPKFTVPLNPSFCVINILSAVYDGQPEPAADIVPDPLFAPPYPNSWVRPDWFILDGTTELDLIGVSDNCCLGPNAISWIIEFAGTDPNQPDISGTGQPSAVGPIILWGTPTNTDVTHTITYTVADCNGNTNGPVTIDIIIKPRPDVIKQ